MNDHTMSTLRDELARQDAAWADAVERLERLAADGATVPEEVIDVIEAFDQASDKNDTSHTLTMMGALRA